MTLLPPCSIHMRCLRFLRDVRLHTHVPALPLCRAFLQFNVTLHNLLKVIYLASDFVVMLCISVLEMCPLLYWLQGIQFQSLSFISSGRSAFTS